MTNDVSEPTLEIEIEQLFEEGVKSQSGMSQAGRAKGFHISGLSYPCLRKIQWEYEDEFKDTTNHEEGEDIDMESLYRPWIGTQLHLTPISVKHEWPLYQEFEVDGKRVQVHGHIDEIYERLDGTMTIVDKKFVGMVPREPNEHHMRQISYYAAIFAHQTGAKVTHGAVLYFCPTVKRWAGQQRMRVFTFPINTQEAWKALEEKVTSVSRASFANTISERKPDWYCQYCRFKDPCIALSGPLDGQRTLDEQK